MKKKSYSTPQMNIVMLQQQQALLIGSYDGPANAPEFEFEDFTDANMMNPTPTIDNSFMDTMIDW
jgi:hypothetical protein